MASTTKSLTKLRPQVHHKDHKSLRNLIVGWSDGGWKLESELEWLESENLEHWPIFLKYSSDCVWFAFSCKLSKGPPGHFLYFYAKSYLMNPRDPKTNPH